MARQGGRKWVLVVGAFALGVLGVLLWRRPAPPVIVAAAAPEEAPAPPPVFVPAAAAAAEPAPAPEPAAPPAPAPAPPPAPRPSALEPPPDASPHRGTEAHLRSAFVDRFVRFASWPGGVLADPSQPFQLCIAGEGEVTERLMETTLWATRPVNSRRTRPDDDYKDCHVLFVAEDVGPSLEQILATATGRPILTIGDTPGFGERGVMLNLIRRGPRLAFEVNPAAAARSGVQLSPRLVSLGTVIAAR